MGWSGWFFGMELSGGVRDGMGERCEGWEGVEV